MPLQKQTFRVNFGQGLDTKGDPKSIQSGKMTVLQNAQFITTNRLSKRNGFARTGADDSSGRSIKRLTTFGSQILGFGPDANNVRSIYTYGQPSSSLGFTPISGVFPNNDFVVSTTSVLSGQDQLIFGDCASFNGYSLYLASDQVESTAIYRIIQESSGSVVLSGTFTTVIQGGLIRCLTSYKTSTNSAILYTAVAFPTVNEIRIKGWTISEAGAGSVGPILTPTSTLTFTGFFTGSTAFDWMSDQDGNIFVAYQSSATKINFIKVDGTVPSVLSSTSVTMSSTVTQLGCIMPIPSVASTTYAIVYSDSNSRLHYVPFNTSLTMGTITQSATNDTTIKVITGQVLTSHTTQVFISSNTSATLPQTIGEITPYLVNSSGTFSSGGNKILGVGITSKPIYINDNSVYLWTIFPSEIQGQYILYSNKSYDGSTNQMAPSARVLSGQAMSHTQGGYPIFAGNVSSPSSNQYRVACTVIGQQYSTTTGIIQLPSVSSISMDYSTVNAYCSSPLNSQISIAGGFNMNFDNRFPAELGFFTFPEGYTASSTQFDGVGIGPGVYQYVCTYEYTDSLGNLHRSETGVPLSVMTVSVSSSVTISVPSLRSTLRGLFSSDAFVNIALYRTTSSANPAIFYRASTAASDPSVQSVDIIDSLPDSALTQNQILYTQGGVLDNFTIDGTSVICAGPDRLFASDSGNTGSVRIGKPYNQTEGLSFFSGITIQIPSDGGQVTSMKYMDGSLIIFKARSIYAVQGNGPTSNGQNNGYSPAQLITNDVGCDGPNASTLYPDGILFKSSKGYFKLGRDLSFASSSNYVGSPVESFNGSSCLRAITREDLNEVRFLLSDNQTILVYNYFFDQWSSIITSASDMATVNGIFYVSNNSPGTGSLVGIETVGTFVDVMTNPTTIGFTITTGWIALNNLQGMQRIYRIRLLGDLKSTHTLKVELAYDYESSFAETHTITSANITTGSSAYQCELFPIRQKCESVQMRISDTSISGEDFDLTDMEIEVGVLPGKRFPIAGRKAF